MAGIVSSIGELHQDKFKAGTEVQFRGRVHTYRATSSMLFLLLRDGFEKVQAIAFKKALGNPAFKELKKSITRESILDVYGKVHKLPEDQPNIKTATVQDKEISIDKIEIVSRATEHLPIQVEDAEGTAEHLPTVEQATRLDHRIIDLRTNFNQAIFRMRAHTLHLFRDYFFTQGFTEITSPKILGAASEGGAEVFTLKYFGKDAFLAQSPQLYKQMGISADFNGVYETGPVFRAEGCDSHRHLCEYTGLDVEMAIPIGQTYHYVLNNLWGMLTYVFDGLKCNTKLLEIVNTHSPFEPMEYPKEPLIIPFTEGVKMLVEAGEEQNMLKDLNSANEKKLGELVKTKYGSDLFILDKYPLAERPFYTMPDELEGYSKGYDIIMRGEEICSGAQRVHDYEMLLKRITECSLKPDDMEFYTNAFKYGVQPHAGGGFGLERVVALYLNLHNIRRTTYYPRDPSRLVP